AVADRDFFSFEVIVSCLDWLAIGSGLDRLARGGVPKNCYYVSKTLRRKSILRYDRARSTRPVRTGWKRRRRQNHSGQIHGEITWVWIRDHGIRRTSQRSHQ